MAGDNTLKYLLIGGAAYLAYEYFFATPAATPVTSTPATGTTTTSGSGTTTTSGSGSTTSAAPTTVQQLQTAAGAGVTTLNADEWSFYWTQIGKPTLSPTQFASTFFPNGRPTDATTYPQYTASQFVTALSGAGISGLGNVGFGTRRIIQVPLLLVQTGRGFGQFDLGDLRRAGGH